MGWAKEPGPSSQAVCSGDKTNTFQMDYTAQKCESTGKLWPCALMNMALGLGQVFHLSVSVFCLGLHPQSPASHWGSMRIPESTLDTLSCVSERPKVLC